MFEAPAFRSPRADHLRLGLFSANCKGGLAISTAPGGWNASWENNLKLAEMADAAGLDFHLPVARWIGSAHPSGWMDESLDPIAWASALLARTRRIQVFATLHTAMHHPIAAAKACATASQIGDGRFGLNIVCGWNKPEYDMFGLPFQVDHVEKYAHGQEWFDIVQRIWTEQAPFDHAGEHWQLRQVRGQPQPVGGQPVVVNAAASPDGRAFALRNSDYLLTVSGNRCCPCDRQHHQSAGRGHRACRASDRPHGGRVPTDDAQSARVRCVVFGTIRRLGLRRLQLRIGWTLRRTSASRGATDLSAALCPRFRRLSYRRRSGSRRA
jgi:alkanesulfonate monooxygenase SsuD/methylene tetrahydromethanopterin reductase-like flavin-dependent oxidoreductase (luciferase family)